MFDRFRLRGRATTLATLESKSNHIPHLYGLICEDFAYILDTFSVLRRKDLAAYGEYQSKR